MTTPITSSVESHHSSNTQSLVPVSTLLSSRVSSQVKIEKLTFENPYLHSLCDIESNFSGIFFYLSFQTSRPSDTLEQMCGMFAMHDATSNIDNLARQKIAQQNLDLYMQQMGETTLRRRAHQAELESMVKSRKSKASVVSTVNQTSSGIILGPDVNRDTGTSGANVQPLADREDLSIFDMLEEVETDQGVNFGLDPETNTEKNPEVSAVTDKVS